MLSFDANFIPDRAGYSFYGQTTKTILRNTTIPMPLNGSHTIQVFGNDSLGTMYQSELRYFTVGTIPETLSEIPGYNLILLIGVSCVVIGVIVKKKLKF